MTADRPPDPVPRAGAGDAARLNAELRASREPLFDRLADARRAPALPLAPLVEALEQRVHLEDQWLLPALAEAGQRNAAVRFGFELEQLREAVLTLDATPAAAAERRRGLELLDGMVALHVGALDARLFETAGLDCARLATDLAAMRERRAAEVRARGSIEDEEADPVGRPPR